MIDCATWLNGCDRIFLIRKEGFQKEVGGPLGKEWQKFKSRF